MTQVQCRSPLSGSAFPSGLVDVAASPLGNVIFDDSTGLIARGPPVLVSAIYRATSKRGVL